MPRPSRPGSIRLAGLIGLITTLLAAAPAAAAPAQTPATKPAAAVSPIRNILADYDDELRGPDKRVDADAMAARLKELGVNTYFWLIWHAPTDWDDLKLFLPKAAKEGIDVWVYLVPASESPPRTGLWSEPFRLDFNKWAEEIAKLSLQHPNLKAWVVDDFTGNFKPEDVRGMQARAKAINPRLAFLPLLYYEGRILSRPFIEDYHDIIDGAVIAYPKDRGDIERAYSALNDGPIAVGNELFHPWKHPAAAGDFVMASRTVKVLPGGKQVVRFRERDDFTGPTAGHHFKQLLVDGQVVWDQDIAGGKDDWSPVEVDVSEAAKGKTEVTISLRLFAKKGCGDFGVRWLVEDLKAEGLETGKDLGAPEQWKATKQGGYETGFGGLPKPADRRFSLPLIVMTAASASEFGDRHGNATPARVAEWLRMSLEAFRDGKCAGVVTYCLDKRPDSAYFEPAKKLFQEFAGKK
ncbi:MAG: hypothetical protein NTW19_12305 [Planctomycetota bacterium]|nr:hypothetical protein [Planctomycetota bacterium]